MKTPIFRIVLLCIIVIISLTAQSWGAGSTAIMPVVGDGSSGNPYEISSLGNLYWITAPGTVDELTQAVRFSKFYIQTADIDALATQYWDDEDGNSDGDPYNDPNDLTSTGNNEGWLPIGTGSEVFTGSYNGQGYTITGLHINRSATEDIGLFGQADNGFTIQNVGLVNVNITGQYQVGSLVGGAWGPSAVISNCNTTGTVDGVSLVGGLVGYVEGENSGDKVEISGCYASVAVTSSSDYIGGLVGYAKNCAITNSYATGDVTGSTSSVDEAGGLLGGAYGDIIITSCYATGAVTNSGSQNGGLVGYAHYVTNSLTITKSYASGNVTGQYDVGGLVGYVNNTTINSSYATGTINGEKWVGGLAGEADVSTFTNSYARGTVTGTNTKIGGLVGRATENGFTNCYSTGAVSGVSIVGGLIGEVGTDGSANTYTANFWDTQSSGTNNGVSNIGDPAGVIGKITTEMTTAATFTDVGWDFTINGEDDDWRISSVNNSYPHLVWAESVDVSLPVELTSFTAECLSGGVILRWSTESEIENLGFVIEKKCTVGTNHDLPSSWSQIASYTSDDVLTGHGSTSEKYEFSFTDAAVISGATYSYRLGDVDYSGKVTWHKTVEITVEASDVQVATTFGLHKVYPNPFNPSVTLSYGLKNAGPTSLQVYNMRGQLVKTLVNTNQIAGNYDIRWQPVNLSAGVYIVRLQSGNQTYLQKIVFVK